MLLGQGDGLLQPVSGQHYVLCRVYVARCYLKIYFKVILVGFLNSSHGLEEVLHPPVLSLLEKVCIWCDREGSSDTHQSFTRFPVWLVLCVRSITFFLLPITKLGLLFLLRISRCEYTRYSTRRSPVGFMSVIPHGMWCALALHPLMSCLLLLL
jgi:hypothetical protein